MDSEIIQQVNDALLPSAFIILMGVMLRRWQPAGLTLSDIRRVISTLVLILFYPALIFAVIPHVTLSGDIFSAPLISTIVVASVMLVCWLMFSLLVI